LFLVDRIDVILSVLLFQGCVGTHKEIFLVLYREVLGKSNRWIMFIREVLKVTLWPSWETIWVCVTWRTLARACTFLLEESVARWRSLAIACVCW